MTAYDCYLPALAKQMGYDLPRTEVDRKAFWTALSRQLIYRRDPEGNLEYKTEDWLKPEVKAVGRLYSLLPRVTTNRPRR